MQKITDFLKEVKIELKRVVWPTKKQTVRSTLTVIAVSLGVALFLGLLDIVFTFLFDRFILG